MLLGDRSFVDSSVVLAFQKTAAYHVLVVAGLHVGALVIFLFWIGRRLRLPASLIGLLTLLALIGYVGMIQPAADFARGVNGDALFMRAAAFPACGFAADDRGGGHWQF